MNLKNVKQKIVQRFEWPLVRKALYKCSPCTINSTFHFMSTVLSVSEEARQEVVDFFQKLAPETDTQARDNPGWILLNSLLSLLTTQSSVSGGR